MQTLIRSNALKWLDALFKQHQGNKLLCRKRAYLLHSHNIVGDLRCYLTKASFEDEVMHCLLSGNWEDRILHKVRTSSQLAPCLCRQTPVGEGLLFPWAIINNPSDKIRFLQLHQFCSLLRYLCLAGIRNACQLHCESLQRVYRLHPCPPRAHFYGSLQARSCCCCIWLRRQDRCCHPCLSHCGALQEGSAPAAWRSQGIPILMIFCISTFEILKKPLLCASLTSEKPHVVKWRPSSGFLSILQVFWSLKECVSCPMPTLMLC